MGTPDTRATPEPTSNFSLLRALAIVMGSLVAVLTIVTGLWLMHQIGFRPSMPPCTDQGLCP